MTPQFEIAFTEDHWMDERIAFRGLRLTLQNYAEEEGADLTFWSTKDYENQWLTGLNQLMASRDKGALIISIHDPANAFGVRTWTCGKRTTKSSFKTGCSSCWKDLEHLILPVCPNILANANRTIKAETVYLSGPFQSLQYATS